MKKETTIIATVEITKVMKNFSFENKTLEETKQDVKNSLTNHIKKDNWFNADNVNVCDVKIFELEKEEHISTEDLIKYAKDCNNYAKFPFACRDCVFDGANCKSNLVKALADRLEELRNQQKATPTEDEDVSHDCTTCKYTETLHFDEPCFSCKGSYTNYSAWERA